MSESESLSSNNEDDEKDPNYVDWKNMENIRVICRFRPINSREIREEKSGNLNDKPPIISDNGRCCKVHREGIRSNTAPMEFYLDRILPPTTTQQNLYLNVGKPMVEACLEGYNTTIFAYGQTGSGKTYTMFGPEKLKNNNELGCVQRALSFLFTELNQRKDNKSVTEWKVVLHFVQLYREKLMDLLEPMKGGLALKIRFDPQTNAPYVPNLKQVEVSELCEIIKLLAVANRNRVTSKTLMNAESSRSHMIMTLTIEQTLKDGTVKKSKLNFADLAGSETYEKAIGGTRGTIDRNKVEELKTINLSLTNLTTCINYLSKGRKASYRSSQLTFYLMDSLGGNSKTTLVVAASPHIFNRNETIRTLRFAKTAKSVKNKAKVNKELSKAQLKAMVKKLTRENKQLKAKLAIFEAELIKNNIDLPMIDEKVSKNKKKHKRAKSMNTKSMGNVLNVNPSTTQLLSKTNSSLILKPINENESNNNKSNNKNKWNNNAKSNINNEAYNKLKLQLKSFEDELLQQEEESNILRDQLSKKDVELDGLNEQLQSLLSISSQFDTLKEGNKHLALQLQGKNNELLNIQNTFNIEKEEYKSDKILLEEELNDLKSDIQQYESIMDNMKLNNQQLKNEVNSLRELQIQTKDKENKQNKNNKNNKNDKANKILGKYFTVVDKQLNDKQLNDAENKIQKLSQNIVAATQAYEKFTGHNFSLDFVNNETETDNTNTNNTNNGNVNENGNIKKKEEEIETKKKKKTNKKPTTSSALQNRMAMFGGGTIKKKKKKLKSKNKIKEYTDSIETTQDSKTKTNLVFQTERLTHYLNSAINTIDKQKKLHSEELESKINKKNTIITNLSIENNGLKQKLNRELNDKNLEIEELKKQIDDLKLQSQSNLLTKNMNKENIVDDDDEEDLFDVNDQIAYLSNITKSDQYDDEITNNKLKQNIVSQHNPTQIALWRQQLQIGSKLDCLDEACLWWTSNVTDSDGYKIKVRYDGFDARWDEWVDRGSTRIAPFLTKAKGGRESKGVSVNLKVVATKKDKRTGRTKRIYKQGFLVKQGKRFKSYKTRYFTLMDDGNMDYFKKMTDQTPAGTFNVKNMIETRRIAYPNKKDLYGFEIVTKERTWRFQAHADDVVADWIGVIHAVSKGVEPNDDDGQQTVIYSGLSNHNTNTNNNTNNTKNNKNKNTIPNGGRHSRGLSIQEESSSHPPINRAAFSQLMDSPTSPNGSNNILNSHMNGISVLNEDNKSDEKDNENNNNTENENDENNNNENKSESNESDNEHGSDNNDDDNKMKELEGGIEHSGWMHKAGKWDANWTYRYCILTGEPITLRCYVAPNKKQTHCIKFSDVKSCIELKKNSDKFGQLEIPTAFAFQLCTSSRIYTFACKSRHEVNVWLKKIRKVVTVSSSSNTAKYTKRSSIVKFGSTITKLGTSFGRLIGVTSEHVTTTEVLKTQDVQIQKNQKNNPTGVMTKKHLSQLNEWNNINVNTMDINGISADRRSSMPVLTTWSPDENPNNDNKNDKKKGRRKSAPDLRALKNPEYIKDLKNLEIEFKENLDKIDKIDKTNELTRHRLSLNEDTIHNENNILKKSKTKNKKKDINDNIASVLKNVQNENNHNNVTSNGSTNIKLNNVPSNDSDEDDLSDMDS